MQATRVLWVGGDARWPSDWPLKPDNWWVDFASPDAAAANLPCAGYDAIVLEFPTPDWERGILVEAIERLAPGVPTLIRDSRVAASCATRFDRPGGGSPTSGELALPLIAQAVEARQAATEDWRRFLIGDSQPMRDVCHFIRLVGARRATVLITGETGSGKEMAARALHLAGPRGRGPFLAINCTALPDNLLEDALFGHVRGAFTGATQNRAGCFEQAQGGVLFLDEIGELPLDLQPKLLRVLQERELQKLGGSETVKVDVRIVAAANCDLEERIALGAFREDLYYRLNVAPIHMPPLRQRKEDIPALAAHFAEKVCRAEGLPLKRIVPETLERLSQRFWPGNVRQLENAVEMAVALSGDSLLLTPADFPPPAPPRIAALSDSPCVSVPDGGLDYESTVADIERSILGQALRKTGGNKKAAADMLRLKRTTLSAKVRSLESAACN